MSSDNLPTTSICQNTAGCDMPSNEELSAMPLTTSNVSVSATSDSASTNWHLHFKIPDLNSFSGCVQQAVSTGVVTGKARREVVQVLRTYITAHTIVPTSEQYVAVCQKLITKFPKLQDSEGTSHFVSVYYS